VRVIVTETKCRRGRPPGYGCDSQCQPKPVIPFLSLR
jgi:hypothetical protein